MTVEIMVDLQLEDKGSLAGAAKRGPGIAANEVLTMQECAIIDPPGEKVGGM